MLIAVLFVKDTVPVEDRQAELDELLGNKKVKIQT